MPPPVTQIETPPPRKPGLDGLRGIAVFLIVLCHSWPQYFPGGFIGVDIFFVLSGFLITQILLRDYRGGKLVFLSQFYMRRALRLLPALWLMAIVMLPAGLYSGTDARQTWLGFWTGVFYLDDWVRAYAMPIAPFMGHTWSLAIEEQFYLLWPAAFLLIVTSSLSPRGRVIAILGLFMLIGAWRAWLAACGTPPIRLYAGLDTHADGLLMGAALAMIDHSRLRVFLGRWLTLSLWLILLAIAAFTAWASYDWPPLVYGGYAAIALLTAILVFAAAEMPPGFYGRVLGWGPLIYIGRISYGLYLWHWPVLCILRGKNIFPEGTIAILSVVLAVGIASLSYRFLEKPVLDIRYRHARNTVSRFGIATALIAALEITIGYIYFIR